MCVIRVYICSLPKIPVIIDPMVLRSILGNFFFVVSQSGKRLMEQNVSCCGYGFHLAFSFNGNIIQVGAMSLVLAHKSRKRIGSVRA